MAELPVDSPFVTKDLDSSCVSCGDKVEELLCLPCLHSVSVCEKKECREKLMKSKILSCSQCKEEFDVPVDGFPCYSFAKRKVISRAREEEGTFCYAEHESPQLAVAFCSDCPGPLCEECQSAHETVAFLKKHKVVPLEEVLKKGSVDLGNSPLCSIHKKELELYCQDCEEVICMACPVVGPHQSHRVVFVDEEVGKVNKQPVVQCIKSADKRLEKMAASLQHVENQLVRIHEQENRSKENISALKSNIFEHVTNRCAVLVAEVEEVAKKRRNDLEEYRKVLQHKMNQLGQFKTMAEDIINNGTTREQLSVRRVMVQRMSTLTSTPIPLPPPSSSSICFVDEKRGDVEKVLSTMGRVSLGAHPPNCTMEGLDIANNTVVCYPWSKPPSFKVVTRDHSGSQCVFGGENVRAVLTPTTCGVPVSGQVEDKGDGTYRVEFKCAPSNQSKLVVTVNGDHIKGSPVKVELCYLNTIKQEIRDPQKERKFRALSVTRSGSLLATDEKNKDIFIFDGNSELLQTFGVKAAGSYLEGVAELSDGNIAVSDYMKHITVYTPNGELVRKFGSDKLEGPDGLAANSKGLLFVADYAGHKVCVYSEEGEFQYSFGSKGSQPGEFRHPGQICIAQDGLVYVNDCWSNRVQVFQQDGCFVRQFGKNVLNGPTGLALTKDGHIVVASQNSHKLSIFTPSGECVYEVKDVGLKFPYGVAIDDNGFIFVADCGNRRIVKLQLSSSSGE